MNLTDIIAHDVRTDHRAGRMLAGLIGSENGRAKVVLTTDLYGADGKSRYHQTFEVKGWNGRNGERMLTVSVAGSGSYEDNVQAIKMFHVDLTNLRVREGRDPRNHDRLLRYAAEAALGYAWLGLDGLPSPGNGSVAVLESENCGICGLPLTDPVSIERGIGPTCANKATGTRTITGRTA